MLVGLPVESLLNNSIVSYVMIYRYYVFSKNTNKSKTNIIAPKNLNKANHIVYYL